MREENGISLKPDSKAYSTFEIEEPNTPRHQNQFRSTSLLKKLLPIIIILVFSCLLCLAISKKLNNLPQESSGPKEKEKEEIREDLICPELTQTNASLQIKKEYLNKVKNWQNFTSYYDFLPFESLEFFKHCEYVIGNTEYNTEIWKTYPKKFLNKLNSLCRHYRSAYSHKFFLCAQKNGILKYLYPPNFYQKVLTQVEGSEIGKIIVSSDDDYAVFSYKIGQNEGIAYKRIEFNGQKNTLLEVKGSLARLELEGDQIIYEDDEGIHTRSLNISINKI